MNTPLGVLLVLGLNIDHQGKTLIPKGDIDPSGWRPSVHHAGLPKVYLTLGVNIHPYKGQSWQLMVKVYPQSSRCKNASVFYVSPVVLIKTQEWSPGRLHTYDIGCIFCWPTDPFFFYYLQLLATITELLTRHFLLFVWLVGSDSRGFCVLVMNHCFDKKVSRKNIYPVHMF
jgi:hypothetical protein